MTAEFSVIVPVRNAAPFLAAAVASIHAQGVVGVEVIVVDDGSTDDSAAIAALMRPAVRLIRQRGAGPASARNAGLAQASGRLLAFLDADDQWPPGRLARQRERLERRPELDGILGSTRLCPEPGGEPLGETPDRFLSILGAGLFRRELFLRVGGFDPALVVGEDLDWLLRAREAGARLLIEPELGLLCRKHAHNLTRGLDFGALGISRRLHGSLARRRAKTPGPAPPLPPLERG